MGLGDWDWCVYAIDTWYKIDNYENPCYRTGNSTQCSAVTKEDICTCIADSLFCTAENNTKL